ncbi:MAG: hypothetical protein M1827_004079 [Pycnora praestabilis]|nr:MAG: hypothetical protein M1827_004079 [Pycnora praestabilis]
MPGILPMKVIKVGTSAQSRIAQACDRCRSKKIRCDGIRPCCSQCANVGFECKTSDKLSRRAFPRGYTESLEERVRALELEVRELKDLLDEKDEKIDILSKIQSHTSNPPQRDSQARRSSGQISPTSSALPSFGEEVSRHDVFRVQRSLCLQERGIEDSTFMGASSGRDLVDAFRDKARESGKSSIHYSTEAFFSTSCKDSLSQNTSASRISKTPSRMLSDQLVNNYFQEWAPLFPVLHHPTFLKLYEKYSNSPEESEDMHDVAQLNLVFAVAASSNDSPDKDLLQSLESRWQPALDSMLADVSLATLECLVLASIYCISTGDCNRLTHYKGAAVGLSYRLGLHQSQKRFSFGALTIESRKKVFWTLYTLDCFSAASLGLPKLLNESDIHAEYPADVDDENITQEGFQSTAPGESTKISNALALFRASRILSKVLDHNYPAASSYDLSLQKLNELDDELDMWLKSLPPHLRLQFVQDKPSTNIVSSRSPFLSLAYYYIRTLIHRPALGVTAGSRSPSAVITVADSSKHIIQVIELLEERRMSFSFCLNKNEMLILSGFGLLFQALESGHSVNKDTQRLVYAVLNILERRSAQGTMEFMKVMCGMVNGDRSSKSKSPPIRKNSINSMPAPSTAPRSALNSTQRRLQSIASRFSFSGSKSTKQEEPAIRRATVPAMSMTDLGRLSHSRIPRNPSQLSVSSAQSEPNLPQVNGHRTSIPINDAPRMEVPIPTPNLDYLPFLDDASTATPTPYIGQNNKIAVSNPSEWERLLGNIENGQTNIYDTIYGGGNNGGVAQTGGFIDSSPSSSNNDTDTSHGHAGWTPVGHSDTWPLASDLPNRGGGLPPPHPAQSVLSFSEESMTSGEDLNGCDYLSTAPGNYNGSGGVLGAESYHRGILMPSVLGAGDGGGNFALDGLDGNFGL